jgi:predicted acyltransferase
LLQVLPAAGGRPVGRVPSIDAFRGLAVLLMALGNFEIGVRLFPDWLKHTPDVGYTVADLVAPMFVVAIGFTVGLSMRRRRSRDGTAAAAGHLVVRALALVGIGAVISAGQALLHPTPGIASTWGVLQCLGVACLLLLPVVFGPTWVRVAGGLALLVGYQWLLDHYWHDLVLHSAHNGLVGTLSWAGLLMLATAVGDEYHAAGSPQRPRLLAEVGMAAATIGVGLAPWTPLSKNQASATYMLLSLGLSVLVLAGFDVALRRHRTRMAWLQSMGHNALVLYVANLVLLSVLVLPGVDRWYAGAPLWLTLAQAVVIAGVNVGLATYLDRRGIVVTL